MKILFASNMYPSEDSPSYGTFVKTNYNHLINSGFIIDKCVIDKKNKSIFRKIISYFSFYFDFFKKIRRKEYDLIYIHYLTITTIPVYICSFFISDIKYVINIHGDDLTGTSLLHKMLGFSSKRLLKKSAGIVIPSTHFKKILNNKFPFLELSQKTYIYPSGGVDKIKFKPSNKIIKNKGKKIIFGFLGRIEEGKGWFDLLSAIEILPKNLNAEFHFYGDGKEILKFNKFVNKMDNKNYIFYHGSVSYDRVPIVFDSFDFFIFPTHRESLGLVLIESMAMGIPAIVSRIEPLTSIYKNFDNHFFEKNNPNDLSRKIKEFYQLNDSDYHLMSRKISSESELYDSNLARKQLSEFLKRI